MRCEKCKIGDYHFQQEIFRWKWYKFWCLKEVGYIFICDNCCNKKEIMVK